MKKIRINELARELEVKPGVIIEMLPELGVQEKKTHSSSVDEDVALELRHRLLGPDAPPRDASTREAENNGHQAIASDDHTGSAPEEASQSAERVVAAAGSAISGDSLPGHERVPQALRADESFRAARPLQPALGHRGVESPPGLPFAPSASRSSQTPSPVATPEEAVLGTPAQPVPGQEEKPAPSFRPLRPPLGGSSGAIHPPLAHTQQHTATPGLVNRTISIPARPLPPPMPRTGPPRPLGPRQPLPPEPKAPSEPGIERSLPGLASEPARPATPAPARPSAPAPQGSSSYAFDGSGCAGSGPDRFGRARDANFAAAHLHTASRARVSTGRADRPSPSRRPPIVRGPASSAAGSSPEARHPSALE